MTNVIITQTASDDSEEHQHRTYDVTIDDFTVQTIVTRSVSVASAWLRETNASTNNNRSNVVVGFDTKVRPARFIEGFDHHHPLPIILLCFDNRCLIYQILQQQRAAAATDDDNSDLKSFFAEGSGYKLIGENIKFYTSQLFSDYNLDVATTKMELSAMAAAVTDDDSLKGMNVRELAYYVLSMEIYDPLSIVNTDWDREILSMEQVKNAVLDVYLTYKIGMVLEAYDYDPIDSCEDGTISSDD